MNNHHQTNKTGNDSLPKPSQQKDTRHEQKEPVARNVKSQRGGPGQATRKAQANVTPIDQGRDRE